MTSSITSDSRQPASPVVVRSTALGALVILTLLLTPFLLHCLARVARATPIDYNEGWNAYHTARLIQGDPLYPPVDGFPVTPVNYPPLSFLVFGALARMAGPLVLTGRVVSFACLLLVSWLVFRTIVAMTVSRLSGALGTVLWLGLAVRLAPAEIGSYNEQMLGHVFTSAALYLHTMWRADIGHRRTWLLALLCCLGLFVKQLLIAVPAALAIAMLLESRRRFLGFAAACLTILAAFAAVTRLIAGEHVSANLLAFNRQMDAVQRIGELRELFVARGALVLFVPAMLMLGALVRERTALPAYVGVSLALGVYAAGGVGIDRNAWLDFFIASALACGVVAGKARVVRAPWQRWLVSLALLAGIIPVAARSWSELGEALDYGRLEREEQAYLADVELLRGVPGPALFEEPLLGFDAGKEFLFDPFSGSQMILSGRLPESILTDRLERREFAAVVLTSRDVEESRLRLQRTGRSSATGPPRRAGWWTRATLEAVRDHYVLHAPDRRRYAFFYLPSSD